MALIETDPGLNALVFDEKGGTHTGDLHLLEMGPDRYNDVTDLLVPDDMTNVIVMNSIRRIKHSTDLLTAL